MELHNVFRLWREREGDEGLNKIERNISENYRDF